MTIEVEDKTESPKMPRMNPGEGDFVLGYGYFEIPSIANVLMTVWEREGELMACKRVRVYMDNKIHGSADKRQFITMTPKKPTTREEWWAHMEKEFMGVVNEAPTPPPGLGYEKPNHKIVRIFGSCEDWMNKFTEEDFAHVRVAAPKDGEAYDLAILTPESN